MEVFPSIQGEGRYIGQPQVFVRLAGCPLRCRWCDTPGSWKVRPEAKAHIRAVGEAFHEPAWASPLQVLTWVGACEAGEPRTISVTGGEPLLWPEFILGLASMVGDRPIHLETAGAHPEALGAVIEKVQHVSLDLKLPADMDLPVPVAAAQERSSATHAPQSQLPWDEESWTQARRRCLHLVASRNACAKIVLAGGRPAQAYWPLLEDVAQWAPKIPVYLQPVTPTGGVTAPEPELWEDLVETARDLELEVLVIPQVHRFLGIP